jgi:hypothetical protein
MAKKIDAWEADDGSLHRTEVEADNMSRELKREGYIHDLADRLLRVSTPHEMVNQIKHYWEFIVEIVNEYERPSAFTSEQLLNLYRLSIWGSQDGSFTHIASMSDNHLANAYKIANEEKRPGYEVYRKTLLFEMTQRGLRKEVTLE